MECTPVTASGAAFSGYNRGVHDLAQNILVSNAHAQAVAGVLGRFSGLPATLPGGAAFARSRESLRRRLIFPHPQLFSRPGAILRKFPQAAGINTQRFEKRMNMATQTISNAGPKIKTDRK